VFRDWPAAWRTWCRNEVKFSAGRRVAPRLGKARHKTASELIAEMDGGFGLETPDACFVPSERMN
jgi:hypothetical protein